MNKFIVKVKVRRDPISHEERPLIKAMKVGMPYCVLDTLNWREKNKETDTYFIQTRFLIGDQDTGELTWIDSHGVDFISIL
jgi:hypothetical protein